jgi:hypothetical protein
LNKHRDELLLAAATKQSARLDENFDFKKVPRSPPGKRHERDH